MTRHTITATGTGHTSEAALRSLLASVAQTPATEEKPKVRKPNPKMRRDVDYKALRALRGAIPPEQTAPSAAPVG